MPRLVISLVALAACGPGEREGGGQGMPDAAMDAIIGVRLDSTAPAECYASTTTVEVEAEIQIVQSCAVWNSLSELAGTATVTRTANNLSIDFGNGVLFTGTLGTSGAVYLTYVHDHPFTDGCGWRATETMIGQLDQTSCAFELDYDYVEAVVINNGGCASPCGAQANVTLDLTPIIL
jgi:hypothetical protein